MDPLKNQDDVNYVVSKYPLAHCNPETLETNWRPGLIRKYVVMLSPHSREAAGNGNSPEEAWASAAINLKEVEKNNPNPQPPKIKARSEQPTPPPKPVSKEWNSQLFFEEWACLNWNVSKDSLWMRRDPEFPIRYIQEKLQAAWEGWQARDATVKPRKRIIN